MNMINLLFKSVLSFFILPIIFIIGTFIENQTVLNLFLSAGILSAIYFGLYVIVQIRKEIFGG